MAKKWMEAFYEVEDGENFSFKRECENEREMIGIVHEMFHLNPAVIAWSFKNDMTDENKFFSSLQIKILGKEPEGVTQAKEKMKLAEQGTSSPKGPPAKTFWLVPVDQVSDKSEQKEDDFVDGVKLKMSTELLEAKLGNPQASDLHGFPLAFEPCWLFEDEHGNLFGITSLSAHALENKIEIHEWVIRATSDEDTAEAFALWIRDLILGRHTLK